MEKVQVGQEKKSVIEKQNKNLSNEKEQICRFKIRETM